MTHPTKPAPRKPPAVQPETPQTDDIVQDMLALVLQLAPGFTQALADRVDAQMRARWGGDRPYIALRRGEGLSSRNAAIRRDYLAGERISLLERRYGLSERQLLRIVKASELA